MLKPLEKAVMQPGQIAETVLMPGDPYRARWAAETFLETPVLINDVRGMLGFTGTWRGHRVTIQGSGMGMPSLSIYANELIRDYGAKTLIRIGSTGAIGTIEFEPGLERDLPALYGGAAEQTQDNADVLFHGHVRVEGIILEDHRDIAVHRFLVIGPFAAD